MRLFSWINIRLVLMFAAVIFLFSFASKRNSKRRLVSSQVVFVGENLPFLSEKTVNKLLIENKSTPQSIGKDELDLNKLEGLLEANALIDSANVFVSIDGMLKAVVKQKDPIARVFEGDGSFYIDYKGNTMPLSANYTARVLLVSGKVKENNRLHKVLRLIYDDSFLKKNIISIQIMSNGSLLMLNRNYDYKIDFGGMVNVEKKFKNYKAFFQKAVLDSSLFKYKKIDLRFTQQVVCTK
jgi:cell division protein FtsQ